MMVHRLHMVAWITTLLELLEEFFNPSDIQRLNGLLAISMVLILGTNFYR
jgi:hypothetical protein